MAIVYEEEKTNGLSDEQLLEIGGLTKKRHYHGAYRPKSRKEISKYVKQYYEEHREDYKAARDRYRAKLAAQGIDRGDEHTVDYYCIHRLRESYARSLKYLERGRITIQQIKDLLMEEEKWRAEQYINNNGEINKSDMEKKRILCILGELGVGKTLASLHLKNHCGANVICSYTTRAPIENEVEGREHHFIDMVQPSEYLLAYTVYGSYSYFALKSQVHGPLTIYVIDEKGLETLRDMSGSEYEIFTLFITRTRKLRLLRGVSAARMDRDKGKHTMSLEDYDYVIENNSTKRELFNNIERIYNELLDRR